MRTWNIYLNVFHEQKYEDRFYSEPFAGVAIEPFSNNQGGKLLAELWILVEMIDTSTSLFINCQVFSKDSSSQVGVRNGKCTSYNVQVYSNAFISLQQHVCKRNFRQCFRYLEFWAKVRFRFCSEIRDFILSLNLRTAYYQHIVTKSTFIKCLNYYTMQSLMFQIVDFYFLKFLMCWQILLKQINIKFHENLSS
jgi:hypothetical protein